MIEYFIGGEKRYLINGHSFTEAEVEELRQKYFKKSYEERMVGFYDKWYRYNTFDDGASYDLGVMAATQSLQCLKDCCFIECLH